MGLESGTFLSDLVKTNPPSSDLTSQGDDHLRLVKTVLQNTFPNASKAFYFPVTTAKSANFSAASTDMNNTFLVDTTAGAINATMPTLAAGDAGWFCNIMKVSTDVNPIFIIPPSGTIQSGPLAGLAKTRRCIPGVISRVWWTGSAWLAERAEKSPVGAVIDFDGTSLPVGYELPNGQTLSGTAGSVYPDYYAVKTSLVVPDITGRVTAMKEASATRLTVAGCGVDGSTLRAAGGEQTHLLVLAETPSHNHGGSTGNAGSHSHTVTAAIGAGGVSGGGGLQDTVNTTLTTSTAPDHAHTIATAGSDGVHNNVQPIIVLNKLLVVE